MEELEDHVVKPEDGGVPPGDLPEHDLDPRHKFKHQTILKKGHLSVGVRIAIGMAALLLDEHDLGVPLTKKRRWRTLRLSVREARQ